MEDWPEEKKQRIREIINSLNFPREGKALDFGCGNGVFTAVLKESLPHWEIHGCDISEVAIENAKERNPQCFFFLGEVHEEKKFDFVFSHHVLEHVFELNNTADQISRHLKDRSRMFHILPCGNEGSFEHAVCHLRRNGIDAAKEGRFFFEDDGHVRRMTTASCTSLFKKYGFELQKGFYSGQYWGAVKWITEASPFFVFRMLNPFKGKDIHAKFQLLFFLSRFLTMNIFRLPNTIYKRTISPIYRALLYAPARCSVLIDKRISENSLQEWKNKKTDKNGSEMYLYFERGLLHSLDHKNDGG
jgi:SAM-dependent methyltransferase